MMATTTAELMHMKMISDFESEKKELEIAIAYLEWQREKAFFTEEAEEIDKNIHKLNCRLKVLSR